MPRKPGVYRSVLVTECTVMIINGITGRQETIKVVLPYTYKNNEAILKAVRSRYETENVSIARVLDSTQYIAKTYMSHYDYIEKCNILNKEPVSNLQK